MKKQLLIMIVALFALGISGAYAQTCPTPRTIECLTSDALHPVAGTPYTYEVTVPTPPGTNYFTWYVTQNQQFINAGVLNNTTNLEPIGGTYVNAASAWYNTSTAGQNTISITWQSFTYDPANPVFVVINVVNDNGTCNTQNLKVYRIEPQNAFTLDLANVDQTGATMGYDVDNSFCIHDVVSATYNGTDGVIYDFGVDYMYFVVTAANWNTSWLPSIQLTGIDAAETVTVEWAYAPTTPATFTADGTFTLAAGTWTTATPVLAQAAGGNVGALGECIMIRVTLDHSDGVNPSYEGLTDEPVTLAVDGQTNLAAVPTTPDVHYSNTAPVANALCGLADGFQFDLATQTLTARPNIQTGPTMPAPGLLPVRP
jgi:hypothetical protein